MAIDGTFINANELNMNVVSHESTRQLIAGHGLVKNTGTMNATVTNNGTGDAVGFIRDWDDKPDAYTLHIRKGHDVDAHGSERRRTGL